MTTIGDDESLAGHIAFDVVIIPIMLVATPFMTATNIVMHAGLTAVSPIGMLWRQQDKKDKERLENLHGIDTNTEKFVKARDFFQYKCLSGIEIYGCRQARR